MSDQQVPAADSGRPESPCIRVCELDAQRLCRGCRRTLEEIVAWARMTAAEQRAVLDELPRRGPPGAAPAPDPAYTDGRIAAHMPVRRGK